MYYFLCSYQYIYLPIYTHALVNFHAQYFSFSLLLSHWNSGGGALILALSLICFFSGTLHLRPVTWLHHHFLLQQVLVKNWSIPLTSLQLIWMTTQNKTTTINASNSLPYTYCIHVQILAIFSPYTVILISHCVSLHGISLNATSIYYYHTIHVLFSMRWT